jgi:hypothetical protein
LIFIFPEYVKEDDPPACKTESENSEREPEDQISR